MSLKFDCPHCESRLAAEPEHYGLTIDCPECKKSLQVPRPEEIGETKEDENVLKFLCPYCTRRLSATEVHFGKELACPHEDCQKPVLVPRPDWKPIPTTLLKKGSADVNDLVQKAQNMTKKKPE